MKNLITSSTFYFGCSTLLGNTGVVAKHKWRHYREMTTIETCLIYNITLHNLVVFLSQYAIVRVTPKHFGVLRINAKNYILLGYELTHTCMKVAKPKSNIAKKLASVETI